MAQNLVVLLQRMLFELRNILCNYQLHINSHNQIKLGHSWGFRFFFFKIAFIYLTERESAHTQGERRQMEREKQAPCWVGSPTWYLILGPWNHDLSQRQTPNWLSHPGAPSWGVLFLSHTKPPFLKRIILTVVLLIPKMLLKTHQKNEWTKYWQLGKQGW